MQLCKVTGEVWGSRIHPSIEGRKILRLSPLNVKDGSLKDSDSELLAIDMLDASVDDVVLVSSSSGVRDLVIENTIPVKSITVAIVDEVNI